jgi:hypothetical protein
MTAGHSKEIVCCKSCGRDVRGGPYCGKCTGRGGRSRAGEGCRDRHNWRDARVIAVGDILADKDDWSFRSERQWHGA